MDRFNGRLDIAVEIIGNLEDKSGKKKCFQGKPENRVPKK